jgi:hypothetical protein
MNAVGPAHYSLFHSSSWCDIIAPNITGFLSLLQVIKILYFIFCVVNYSLLWASM